MSQYWRAIGHGVGFEGAWGQLYCHFMSARSTAPGTGT